MCLLARSTREISWAKVNLLTSLDDSDDSHGENPDSDQPPSAALGLPRFWVAGRSELPNGKSFHRHGPGGSGVRCNFVLCCGPGLVSQIGRVVDAESEIGRAGFGQGFES